MEDGVMVDGAAIEVVEHLRDQIAESRGIQQPRRGPQDKRNHLTLVELQYLVQLTNIPAEAREPMAFFYAEYIQLRHRGLAAEEVKAGKEWLTYQRDYVHHLLLFSNPVKGWKADRTVAAMNGDAAWQEKHPASQIAGNSQDGSPEAKGVKRRGLFG